MSSIIEDAEQSAGIVTNENTYHLAQWFVSLRPTPEHPHGSDWMAMVTRDPGAPWHLVWRFRYYADDVTNPLLESKDKKSWYEAKRADGPNVEAIIEEHIDQMFAIIAAVKGDPRGPIGKIVFKTSDMDTIEALLRKAPWVHMTKLGGTGPKS